MMYRRQRVKGKDFPVPQSKKRRKPSARPASASQRRESIQKKAEARREAERRRQLRSRMTLALSGIAAVVVVVLVFVLVRLNSDDDSGGQAAPKGNQLEQVVTSVTSVPAATLNKIGKGDANGYPTATDDEPLLEQNGKPEMLYYGTEWCPFCAAQRWPMIVALSRFGTFDGLTTTTSASDDSFPDTPTFSFEKATYTSDHVVFTPIEGQDREGNDLQEPTDEQQEVISKYNAAPYVAEESEGSIPFVDIGNRYIGNGATYSPEVLEDKDWKQIADELQDAESDVAKGIGGSANIMTAQLCTLTDNKPADVCTAPAIEKLNSDVDG